MAKQTFNENDLVIFHSNGISQEEWDDVDMGEITQYEGKIAKILGLACYTELGDKDYEYYDIRFLDYDIRFLIDPEWVIFEAISGYHLTPVK